MWTGRPPSWAWSCRDEPGGQVALGGFPRRPPPCPPGSSRHDHAHDGGRPVAGDVRSQVVRLAGRTRWALSRQRSLREAGDSAGCRRRRGSPAGGAVPASCPRSFRTSGIWDRTPDNNVTRSWRAGRRSAAPLARPSWPAAGRLVVRVARCSASVLQQLAARCHVSSCAPCPGYGARGRTATCRPRDLLRLAPPAGQGTQKPPPSAQGLVGAALRRAMEGGGSVAC